MDEWIKILGTKRETLEFEESIQNLIEFFFDLNSLVVSIRSSRSIKNNYLQQIFFSSN